MTSAPLPIVHPSLRRILAQAIAPAGVVLLTLASTSAWADPIFVPTDQLLGGQENLGTSQFQIGVVGTTGNTNNWPSAESPDHVIDGVAQKYLNFGITNTGFLINPAYNGGNGSVVTSMQLWTANDAEQRDPSSYQIWATNSVLDFGATTFDMSLFNLVTSGNLTLPTGRNGTGTAALNNANSQTVTFANTTGYKRYLIIFPTVKNTPVAANSMQIAEVQLFGIAAFTNLKWTGSTNNVWNINTTPNWTVSGSPSTFSNTNGVTFDDTATGSTSITIQNGGTAVIPAAVVFANVTKNYTIGGDAIASTGTLAVNGTGTVTLNNINNYTNGTTVNAGTLTIGATGSIGSGSLVVNNANTDAGTAVTVNFNSAQSISSLSGAIATPTSGVNTATINLNGNLTITQTTDAAFPGVVAGTGGLIKEGTAALNLSGVNSYAGPTIVNGGILISSAPGDNDHGALPAGQPVTVNTGSSLIFNADDGMGYYAGASASLTVNGSTVISAAGTHSTLPIITLNGGTLTAAGAGNVSNGGVVNYILDGDVTTVAGNKTSVITAPSILLRKSTSSGGPSNPVTFNVPRGTAPLDLLVSSAVSDKAAGLIKSGNGILALTGTNSYTGPTVINGGTVAAINSTALGTGNLIINDSGVLALGSDTLNGFASFTLNGGATIDASSSTLTLTTNAGNQARTAFTPTQVAIDRGFTTSFIYTAGGNRQADGFTFTVQNSSSTAIGGGGGGLAYLGISNSAAVEFNIYTGNGNPVGTNYATGTTGVYLPSTPVNIASGNPIAITLSYSPPDQTITETLYDLVTRETYTNVFNGVDIAGAIGGSSGYIGFTGATGGSAASQTVGNFSFNNFSQGVSIANNVTVAAGATVGFDVLPPSANGAGAATLQGTVTLGSNATLNVTGGATPTNTPYTLTASNSFTIAGNTTINVANNGAGKGSLLLSSVADQATGATLTKTGNGTLKILGAANYTGATTVNGGSLIVNGSIAGSTVINTGGTLGGTGTLSGVNVASGGTVVPGDESIGTITTGPLSMAGGSALNLEIGTLTADQIKVNGGATLAGIISLAFSFVVDPVDGTVFTIIDGTAPLSGYSSGARLSYLGTPLDENQQFTVTAGVLSQTFVISYLADSGHDLTLTAIPEPSTAASLLLCAGIALGLRRPTRRNQGATATSHN